MERKIIEGTGLFIRMLIRNWAQDNKTVSQNFIDFEQFAQNCGLDVFDARNFNFTLESFVNEIARDFIREFGSGIEASERKDEILKQLLNDIDKISLNEERVACEFLEPEKLRNAILKVSEDDRNLWSEKEKELYAGCIRYLSKACIDFISKWPSFTAEALKIILKRQNEFHQDLTEIFNELHSMRNLMKSTEDQYKEYEGIYRDNIIERFSKVELIGSGIADRRVRKYDLSSAYVELECVKHEQSVRINLSDVFGSNNIVWIKGEAGSGKTTFLHWLAVCSAKNENHKIRNIGHSIPIVVELRTVEWPLKLQTIVNKFSHSIGYECPQQWLTEQLKRKQVIVLIDGLDEIKENERESTLEFIEEIAEKYQGIKVLITARNSVKNDLRCSNVTYEIRPMNIGNIKKFVLYWHRAVLYADAVVDDVKIENLQNNLVTKIAYSPALKNLAGNPLLCAMICALNYVHNEQLPENKMEIYEKCCEMLIEARDKQRNIEYMEVSSVLSYTKKKRILEELAYWMLRNNKSSETRWNVTAFLDSLIQNSNIFGSAFTFEAENVLDYFLERSGVIREPEKDEIDFIHKTFLEYLAVKAICRSCDWNRLVEEACNVNWKETIIMCFSEMGELQVNQILRDLVKEGKKRGDDKYILMASMGASNATFTDKTVKEDIDSMIQRMIPPKRSEISQIVKTGAYLIPFLYDKESYTQDEKLRCLELLDFLGTEQTIPALLSFLEINNDIDVSARATKILKKYDENMLGEYNVKEQLCHILTNSVHDGRLTVCNDIIEIMDGVNLNEASKRQMRQINVLEIIFYPDSLCEPKSYLDDIAIPVVPVIDLDQIVNTIKKNASDFRALEVFADDIKYSYCSDFYKSFEHVKYLKIRGNPSNLKLLDYFNHLDQLRFPDVDMYTETLKLQIMKYSSAHHMKIKSNYRLLYKKHGR